MRRGKNKRRPRSCWVRPLAACRKETYDRLLSELRMDDQQSLFNLLGMPFEIFDELLSRVGPRISKRDINYRKALEPGLNSLQPYATLSGDRYPTLQYTFTVSRDTCALFITEVCQAIIDVLKDEVISCPGTPDAWR
ncbi:hypothetical protein HOLleu_04782 [Holothuria leucospilota]|uniref:Uncharacterized protein n=1 Tax=Holothuria leucospilota TaxID=206669 RepID=A0A9Q1HIL0_HOLLE|nr:hypothetical protein HOLleu_04782 [Holothuria leucospilota]